MKLNIYAPDINSSLVWRLFRKKGIPKEHPEVQRNSSICSQGFQLTRYSTRSFCVEKPYIWSKSLKQKHDDDDDDDDLPQMLWRCRGGIYHSHEHRSHDTVPFLEALPFPCMRETDHLASAPEEQ
jgi:hypothetical protein